MLSSYCPKCKRFLTPDLHVCPSCGFNRKKYYESNFFIPEKERNKLNRKADSEKSLNWFLKLKFLIFPGYFVWFLFFHDWSSKEFRQALIITIFNLALFIFLFFIFQDQIAYILSQQNQFASFFSCLSLIR